MRWLPEDFWLGIGLGALSLIILAYLIPAQVGAFDSGAATLPLAAAICLGVLSGILVLSSFFRREASDGSANGGDDESAEEDHTGHAMVGTLAAIVAVMIAYAWLLEWGGFLFTSLIALVALLVIHGVRRPMFIAGIALSVVAALYVGFEILLGAPLPESRIVELIVG